MKIVPKYDNPILNERSKTHGDYSDTALISQRTKDVWRTSKGWHLLGECQRETLEMVAMKTARILSGDPFELDHYVDIVGYLELTIAELRRMNGAS